jgi:hypothetical protein
MLLSESTLCRLFVVIRRFSTTPLKCMIQYPRRLAGLRSGALLVTGPHALRAVAREFVSRRQRKLQSLDENATKKPDNTHRLLRLEGMQFQTIINLTVLSTFATMTPKGKDDMRRPHHQHPHHPSAAAIL